MGKLTSLIILTIFFSAVYFSPSFSQTETRDLMDEYCKENWRENLDTCVEYIPEGYFEQTSKEVLNTNNLSPADEARLQQLREYPDSLKCPKGTYYGVDNQGKPSCRDINTNQIVDPLTGLRFDSQTGNLQLDDSQVAGIVIGIIIFIIIIAAISKAKSKQSQDYYDYRNETRRPFSETTKQIVMEKQNGRCKKCGRIPKHWNFDHVHGRGDNSIENCQGLCLDCHQEKTLKDSR